MFEFIWLLLWLLFMTILDNFLPNHSWFVAGFSAAAAMAITVKLIFMYEGRKNEIRKPRPGDNQP